MASKPTTVGELIQALGQFDPNMKVVIEDHNCEFVHDLCWVDKEESQVEIDGKQVVIISPEFDTFYEL